MREMKNEGIFFFSFALSRKRFFHPRRMNSVTRDFQNINISFDGLENINVQSLKNELTPLAQATTFEQFLKQVNEVHTNLESLGVFSSVQSHVGAHGSSPSVVFKVKESATSKSGNVSMNKNCETVGALELSIPAPLKTLSQINFKLSASKNSKELNASWIFPRIFSSRYSTSFYVTNSTEDYRDTSSYLLHSSMSVLFSRVGVRTMFPGNKSSVSCEVVMTDVDPTLRSIKKNEICASHAILASPLRAVKSCIRYNYFDDQIRINKRDQENGTCSHISCEAAVKGDVNFTKIHVAKEFIKTFNNNVSLSCRLFGGALVGFDGEVPVHEKFFAGGVSNYFTTFRGYKNRRVGETDKRIVQLSEGNNQGNGRNEKDIDIYDAIGNEGIALASTQVSYPIRIEGMPIVPRIFGFADAGIFSKKIDSESLRESIDNPRCTVGVGISFPLRSILGLAANFDVSYSKEIVGGKTDARDPLQFGLRVRFAQ